MAHTESPAGETPRLSPGLRKETPSPSPVPLEKTQNPDHGFEHAKENPLLRQKLIIRKPFDYTDAQGKHRCFDKVPAVLHVLKNDGPWVMLGDGEGTEIAKVLRESLVMDEWNTRQVLRPRDGAEFLSSLKYKKDFFEHFIMGLKGDARLEDAVREYYGDRYKDSLERYSKKPAKKEEIERNKNTDLQGRLSECRALTYGLTIGTEPQRQFAFTKTEDW